MNEPAPIPSLCGRWLFVRDETAHKKPFRWIRVPIVVLAAACDNCGVERGEACRDSRGRQQTDVHYTRRATAAREQKAARLRAASRESERGEEPKREAFAVKPRAPVQRHVDHEAARIGRGEDVHAGELDAVQAGEERAEVFGQDEEGRKGSGVHEGRCSAVPKGERQLTGNDTM